MLDVTPCNLDHCHWQAARRAPLTDDLAGRDRGARRRHREKHAEPAHPSIIPTVRLNPLSGRVLALSWCTALVAWPLAWLVLASAQGIGTLLAGGSWIGVAIPLGAQPWGLVNEPTISFAASRSALFLYWLAPGLLAFILAFLLPTLVPVPPGWLSEVGVFQFAVASATLGLGWAAPLGVADGPASGLERFWGVPQLAFVVVSALLGAAVVQVAVARLNGHLWGEPGGPIRSRRLLVALSHAFPPALWWVAVAGAQGWGIPPATVLTTGAVLVGALVGGWVWTPHAPLRLRPEVGWGRVLGILALGCLVFGAAAWAGAPHRGQGVALVWGIPNETSNVRAGVAVVRITPLPAPRRRPAS